jgi:hypothetical protein
MAKPFDQRLFEQIFSDAHVIDVDFSQWDKLVSLCVVADHVEVPTPSRLPLFLVDFLQVSKFFLTLNHLKVGLEDAEKHFQWNIDDFKIQNSNKTIVISLFGGPTWPKLEIECQEIVFQHLSHAILDDLFPDWNAPYKGLARPGIQSLSRLFRTLGR